MPQPPSLGELREFYGYGAEEQRALRQLRPVFEEHADALVASFYRHLLSFPSTRVFLRDPEVTQRLLSKQREYILSLAGPEIDAAYLEHRLAIGEMHERIGLDMAWYLGAYALYISLLSPLIAEAPDPDSGSAGLAGLALGRLLLLDIHLAFQAYMERHERELERLNRELAASGRSLARDLEASGAALRRSTARVHAAEQLASIGTLVAGLAHEIGTPMGVIQGHAKLLESAVSGDSARWRLRTIQEQISRISKIIQSLLGMARPRSLSLAPVALAPLLENTLGFLSERMARRGIHTVCAFEPTPSALGDPERLQQLFLNLFMNACDAMPGGGELRVELRPGENGDLEIRIADTGHGIPAEAVSRIFEPFFTTKGAGEGNGLGLAVVKGIVADHGGHIELSRSDSAGTEFRVLIPSA